MKEFFVGIVSRNRYEPLEQLLHSVKRVESCFTMLVDFSSPRQTTLPKAWDGIFYNFPDTSVMHGKNAIMRFFLQNTNLQYLFIIEDDVKILDPDVFQEYIMVSDSYNIPHMNFSVPAFEQVVYQYKPEVKVVDKLCGCFQFFTRECLQTCGIMNTKLNANCWEHIEHTYRIHDTMNYNPVFWHFPDYKWSNEAIRMQKVPGTIRLNQETKDRYRKIMCRELGIVGLPLLETKRLTINGK